jgi:hypothetical protein
VNRRRGAFRRRVLESWRSSALGLLMIAFAVAMYRADATTATTPGGQLGLAALVGAGLWAIGRDDSGGPPTLPVGGGR